MPGAEPEPEPEPELDTEGDSDDVDSQATLELLVKTMNTGDWGECAKLVSSHAHGDDFSAVFRRMKAVLSLLPDLPSDEHANDIDRRISLPLLEAAGPSFRVVRATYLPRKACAINFHSRLLTQRAPSSGVVEGD